MSNTDNTHDENSGDLHNESDLEALRQLDVARFGRIHVPGHRLIREIGRGGQSCVYKAIRDSDSKECAVKVFAASTVEGSQGRRRALEEIAVLKQLTDPGIVRVVNHTELNDGSIVLITEFAHGKRIDEYVKAHFRSLIEQRISLFIRVCKSLETAHAKGVTHRDISPANILVKLDATPCILDFGISSVHQSGLTSLPDDMKRFAGKLRYAAPEQILPSKPPSPSADVYALGVMLFETVCEKSPYEEAADEHAVIEKSLTGLGSSIVVPWPDDAPAWLRQNIERIIRKALQRKPADRYQSAGELADDLQKTLQSKSDANDFPKRGPMRRGIDNVTGAKQRAELEKWARNVKSFIAQRKDAKGADLVEQAICEYRTARFGIAIIGQVKRGKSTLVNGLLGRADDLIAPISFAPASSTVTHISYSSENSAAVYFLEKKDAKSIPFEDIRLFATEKENPGNVKGVSTIRVQGPFHGLDTDLELIDTPGAGSLNEHHDVILHEFIPDANAVIYLITASDPLNNTDFDLLRRIAATNSSSKLIFVLNRCDEISSPQELENLLAYNREQLNKLGLGTCPVVPVSALKAFRGDREASGFDQLETLVRDVLAKDKVRVLGESFVEQVVLAASPVLEGLKEELEALEHDREHLVAHLERLKVRKAEIDKLRLNDDKTFLRHWHDAIESLTNRVRAGRDEVIARSHEKVDAAGMLAVGALAKKLPSEINSNVESVLTQAAAEFEQEVREHSCKYYDNYPRVRLSAQPTRLRGTSAPIAGKVLAGSAVAAAGAGVATTAAAVGAAATATTTVAVPTAAGTAVAALGSMISSAFPTAGAALSGIASSMTGTAAITSSAPAWVAIAGPVGWVIAGAGVIAVPLAFHMAKAKQRDKLHELIDDEVRKVFETFERERIGGLEKMGSKIVQDMESGLAREFEQVQQAIKSTLERTPSPQDKIVLENTLAKFSNFLANPPLR